VTVFEIILTPPSNAKQEQQNKFQNEQIPRSENDNQQRTDLINSIGDDT